MVNKILHCIVIGLVLTSLSLSAADMRSGTWKLNTAKSKFSPGPGPKSNTVTYSREGDWVVTKAQGVNAEGKATSSSNRFKLDGKEYPYKTPIVEGMISIKQIDDFNSEATIKGGKASVTSKAMISKDGKTRTLTSTGTNAEGKPVNTVAVYEKQ